MKKTKQARISELEQRVKKLRDDMFRAFHMLEENQTADARGYLDMALYLDYVKYKGHDT